MMTFNAVGNILKDHDIPPGASKTVYLDFSNKVAGQFQVKANGSAAGQVQVDTYLRVGSTPETDTEPTDTDFLPVLPHVPRSQTFCLHTGRYAVTLTNLDAERSVTVSVTSASIDALPVSR